jgi:tetraacyldisaccharide 4'-kinase
VRIWASAAALLQRHWWRPDTSWLALLLLPLSSLFGAISGLNRWVWSSGLRQRPGFGVPVWVVGNLIVGGAGKTPTTLALVSWLKTQGRHPGIISRGYGRQSQGLRLVEPDMPASQCGDEALLLRIRTGVPVAIAAKRTEAAAALLQAHPEIDILVSDDGLQHGALKRHLGLIVFDRRGVGNGHLLPAGPLRQRLPKILPANHWVVYNAASATTSLPGGVAQAALGEAIALEDWWAGLAATPGCTEALRARSLQQPLLAAAGIAEPQRFFSMLENAGLRIKTLPLADHADLSDLPWPADTADVVLTEKDAVKLRPGSTRATRVWVVPLDFRLPPALTDALRTELRRPPPP